MERRKQGFFFWVIDILIFLYTVSIFVMSFDESLNKYSKLIALALMGFLVLYIFARKAIRFNSVLVFFLLFIGFGLLSYFWSAKPDSTLTMTWTLAQIFILVFLIYNYISFEEKEELFLKVLCLSGVVFSLYIIFYSGVSAYFAGLLEGTRMSDGTVNENQVGMTSATSVIIALWFVFYKKKYSYLIFAVICTIVSLGAGSRTAFAILLFGIVGVFVLKGNSTKRLISIMQCVTILVILWGVLQLPAFETFGNRLEMMFNAFEGEGTVDGSTSVRLDMMEVGIEKFLEKPIFGFGLNTSSVITQEAWGWETYLHNNYVELLVAVGLIGTMIYYAMYLLLFAKLFKPAMKNNHLAIIAFVLICTQLVSHFGTVSYYEKPDNLLLILFALVAERIYKNDYQNKTSN